MGDEEKRGNGTFPDKWAGDYDRLVHMAIVQLQYAVSGVYRAKGDESDLALRILEHDAQRQAIFAGITE